MVQLCGISQGFYLDCLLGSDKNYVEDVCQALWGNRDKLDRVRKRNPHTALSPGA